MADCEDKHITEDEARARADVLDVPIRVKLQRGLEKKEGKGKKKEKQEKYSDSDGGGIQKVQQAVRKFSDRGEGSGKGVCVWY